LNQKSERISLSFTLSLNDNDNNMRGVNSGSSSVAVSLLILLILVQSPLYKGSVNLSSGSSSFSKPENESSHPPSISTPDPPSSSLSSPSSSLSVSVEGFFPGDIMYNKYPRVPLFQNDEDEDGGSRNSRGNNNKNNNRKVLRFGVLSPKDVSHQYSMQKVLPPIMMAVQSSTMEHLLPGWKIEVHYRDTKCSSTYGPLAAFDFYNNKTAGQIYLYSLHSLDWRTATFSISLSINYYKLNTVS